MRMSTMSRYGLRAMVAIAESVDAPISCEAIAKREGISKKYLDRIMNTLRRSSLIKSHRGQGGGYSLARKPREISLAEIVACLEAGSGIVPCLADPKRCERSDSCGAREVWRSVESAIEGTLDRLTLADLSSCEY